MVKEDADQLIRCVKECWWRVAIVISLIALFGLLAAYGWPTGDWAFGWGGIGAVATSVTGICAIYFAYLQFEKERKNQLTYKRLFATRLDEYLEEKFKSISYIGVFGERWDIDEDDERLAIFINFCTQIEAWEDFEINFESSDKLSDDSLKVVFIMRSRVTHVKQVAGTELFVNGLFPGTLRIEGLDSRITALLSALDSFLDSVGEICEEFGLLYLWVEKKKEVADGIFKISRVGAVQ